MQWRAVQEVAAMRYSDLALIRAMLKRLVDNPPWSAANRRDIAIALSQAGAPAVRQILRFLEKSDPNSVGARLLLMSLGRMGPTARQAIPALRGLLKDSRTSRSRQADVRVVLANLRHRGTPYALRRLTSRRENDSI